MVVDQSSMMLENKQTDEIDLIEHRPRYCCCCYYSHYPSNHSMLSSLGEEMKEVKSEDQYQVNRNDYWIDSLLLIDEMNSLIEEIFGRILKDQI